MFSFLLHIWWEMWIDVDVTCGETGNVYRISVGKCAEEAKMKIER
jgi:hypothetical protein